MNEKVNIKDHRKLGGYENITEKKLEDKIKDFWYSESAASTATRFTLAFLGMGAIVFTGGVLPGVLKMIESSRRSSKNVPFSKKQIHSALTNIKRRNYVEIIKYKNGETTVKLTNKGKERIIKYSMENMKIKKPKRWDGKWRILIFDIPTKPKIFNLAREALRQKVKELGFRQIQKSVWLFPYECEDELLFIAEAFEVQRYIEILTVEEMLHNESYKKAFDL